MPLATSRPSEVRFAAEASPGFGGEQGCRWGGEHPLLQGLPLRFPLDGLPGIFPTVLGIHPCQIPGTREEIGLRAVGSVVGCRERRVMLRGSVGSWLGMGGKCVASPRSNSPK